MIIVYNGFNNALALVILTLALIVLGYAFTIGDTITSQVNSTISGVAPNQVSTTSFIQYQGARDFLFSAITIFLVPFIIFITFISSFIGNNTGVLNYVISCLLVLIVTPILIFTFADVFTGLTSVSFLNTKYLASLYFNNFLQIMVINMLLSLGSFIFTRGGAITI